MPPLDITRPDIINFLIECYDKTARLRMRWNSLHEKKLQAAATFTSDEKGYDDLDVTKKAMAAGMSAITRDHISSGRNRRLLPLRDGEVYGIEHLRKEYAIPAIGLGDPKEDPRLGRPDHDLTLDPIMRPVSDEQKQIIYKGLPDDGRLKYLKVRNQIAPEDKFYFQECGGWEYGWRMKDSFFGRNAPSYGRVFRLSRGASSRSGPQPDPHHYKNSEIPGPAKCLLE